VTVLAGAAHSGIGSPAAPSDFAQTWSPDASVVVFASTRAPGTLRVVNPDGSDDRPIPVPPLLSYAFSPDWHWIAFPSGGSGAPLVVGAVPPPKGKISLTITLIPDGSKPRLGRRTYTLRCRPAGGTLPKRGDACVRLLRVQNPFAPVPRNVACTQIYGGPQEAVVTGVYGGKRVRTTFTRVDGCQIARWNRVRFLFPIPVGVR
jgi:hypothetical protein